MARNREYDEHEVLQKAMELFWRQGYEKTSMQDLVEHMGIHRRSIYDTFGDKHTLYLKALERYEQMVGNSMNSQIKPLDSVKQSIRRLFEITILRGGPGPKGCLTVNSAVELSLHDDEVAEKVVDSFSKTERLLYELLVSGQESGEIPETLDAEKTSVFFHNSLVGLRVLTKTTDDRQKLESIIDTTLSVLD
ncbi:TetR/AcrR family transcriptional regulator [Planococcus shenhongbingii]|uniref:TetR/AcrR family transcriptional regulator n=1 Tax=Planococcus shenhongbingii TaxID=3058398 RepID=A0ABT8N7N1_9BACL|nr:TetR/AcrR family transcriptional regulator [Planococcus sp. N017]MDN7243888.1 TetR/AcrR family transcriptional regulator [Planococcus sp. N017]